MLMQMFDETQATEADFSPREDPTVRRLEGALREARAQAAAAKKEWDDYLALHGDGANAVPYRREKLRLLEAKEDTAWAADDAERAWADAWALAQAKAQALWHDRIRKDFLADLPAIEAYIALLAKHEATLLASQEAQVRNVLDVTGLLMMRAEGMRSILASVKQQMGLT